MTAEGSQKKGPTDEESQKAILNLADQWKKMYFESEEVMARSIDEYVAGQSFTDFIEQMGSQYLSMYKATTHTADRFFANYPLPTKKDIARVCDLVIAGEEKVDHLEGEFNDNMAGLATSLIKLVDFQAVLKNELLAIHEDVKTMQSQLLELQSNKDVLAAAKGRPVAEITAPSLPADRKVDLPTGEVQSNAVKEETEKNSTVQPPRPRSRTKQTGPQK